MAIDIEIVNGVDFADEASLILREAWPPPALNYTPAYVRWQLSFPSSIPIPAVLVRDGREPVGFGAMSARRFRCGTHVWDSGVVSFIAVRPEWRMRGLSMAIYKVLLGTIRNLGLPIVTFGIEGGIGPRIFTRAYEEAGFQMLSLGKYAAYGCLVQPGRPVTTGAWEAEPAGNGTPPGKLPDLAEDVTMIANDPTEAQIGHYMRDPRRRGLILLRNLSTHSRGAAWVVQNEFVTAHGVDTVTSIDSVYIPGRDASTLPALFQAAVRWVGASAPTLVTAPSLGGFDAETLRKLGIRRTGNGFVAYCCAVDPSDFLRAARTTNLEIV